MLKHYIPHQKVTVEMKVYSVSQEKLTENASSDSRANPVEKYGTYKSTIEPRENENLQRRKKRNFVIEPVMTLYMATYSAMFPLTSQYVLSVMMEAYNVTGNGNGTGKCGEVDKNSTFFLQQQKAQGSAAQFTLIFNLTQGIPAMVVALFLGSYTDHKGRRLALILPTIGMIIRCLMFITQQALNLPLWVTIIGTTLDGLTGSNTIMLTTCYAYISDTASLGNRSFRIMVCESVMNAFQGVLQLSMGYLISGVGYLWPYVLLICLHTINLLYVAFFVPESRAVKNDGKPITPYYIIESFKTLTKKRSYPQPRSILLLCLAAFALLVLGQQSQYSIENVYLLNAPLCMDSILVGYWKTFRLVVQSGALVLFAKFILPRAGDVFVVVISCLSIMIYFILFPFITEVWMAFAVLIPAFGSKMNQPVTRTIISKMVSPDEQGGLISVLYVVEKSSQLVGDTIFNNIYAATLTFFRGTTHMCFATLTGIGMVLIIVYKVKARKPAPQEQTITSSRL